jgi:molybdopterin-guanine dinucleotide biosynthesis protein A
MDENSSEEIELSNITLAIIGGGTGRRMGMPKAWLQIGDESILAWLNRRLCWPGPKMLVSSPATANPPDANLFDELCLDPVDGLGPLRGVLTALEHSTTATVVITAIDMPGVNFQTLDWLAESLANRPDCQGLMCRVSRTSAPAIEPFPSVFRTSAAASIARRLEQGRRSVHSLCESSEFCAIEPPSDWPDDIWTNLNEADQFKIFQTKSRLRCSDPFTPLPGLAAN